MNSVTDGYLHLTSYDDPSFMTPTAPLNALIPSCLMQFPSTLHQNDSRRLKFSDVEVLVYTPLEEVDTIILEDQSLIGIVFENTFRCSQIIDKTTADKHTRPVSSVVYPHNPAKGTLGNSTYCYHKGTSRRGLDIYAATLAERIQFLKERFEEESSQRLKAQTFYSLYDSKFYSRLDLSESDHESCRQLLREFFPKLAKDLQEDIKYCVWYQLGSPDTLGSDFGFERFMENPSDAVCSQAVFQAIFRPRYHPTSSSESLEHQIEAILCFIESLKGQQHFKDSHAVKRKLYVFQAFELAALSGSESIKERILAAFNTSFDHHEKKDIYKKVNELVGDGAFSRHFFTSQPFSGSSMRVMRLEKQLLLNMHFPISQ